MTLLVSQLVCQLSYPSVTWSICKQICSRPTRSHLCYLFIWVMYICILVFFSHFSVRISVRKFFFSLRKDEKNMAYLGFELAHLSLKLAHLTFHSAHLSLNSVHLSIKSAHLGLKLTHMGLKIAYLSFFYLYSLCHDIGAFIGQLPAVP